MVLDLDVGLASLVDNFEGEVPIISINLSIAELATDETLSVEDGIARVHGDLVLGSISNQSLTLTESDIRKGGTVTLVVGNNLNTVILPDTDTTAERKMSVKSDQTNSIQSTYKRHPNQYRQPCHP